MATTATHEIADGPVAHPLDLDFPEEPVCSEKKSWERRRRRHNGKSAAQGKSTEWWATLHGA